MILENRIIDHCLTGINVQLFDALYSSSMTPDLAKVLTDDMNFDDENAYYLALLAKAGSYTKYEGFRADTVPRFQGLLRFHQVKKTVNTRQYIELMRRLRENDIKFICGRYTSLDLRYCRNGFQTVGIFDIVVHECDYARADELIKNADMSATDTEIKNSERAFKTKVLTCDNEDVWNRAKLVEKNGVSVLTLSPTDMLELYGVRIWSNCFEQDKSKASQRRTHRLRWLYEFGAIIHDEEDIDLKYIALHAAKETQRRIRFLLAYAYRAYGCHELRQRIKPDSFCPGYIRYCFWLYRMNRKVGVTDG